MAQICPQCGVALPGDGWQGLCPRCLIRVSFGPDADLAGIAPTPRATPALEPPTGQRIGDYELLEEIGRGGMGVVYRARQIALNRIVAVKTILGGPVADERAVQRFREEAEVLAGLRHPHIVSIHEITHHLGRHLFSMEYVCGQSLADWLRERPACPGGSTSDFRTVGALVMKVADAIQYAHEQGVLHRDLKPSNILLDELGEPRVTDFGCAKRITAQADITYTGHIVGSPQYFAPEQFAPDRGPIGPRTDVFGLGALLYHLLTGRPPRHGETLEAVMLSVIDATLVPPRQWRPDVPPDLETICLKCMEAEPSRRYDTARAVANDLKRFVAGEPILARPVGRLERGCRWARRNRGKVATTVLVLALAAVALSLALTPRFEPGFIPADATLTPSFAVADGDFDPGDWQVKTVWTKPGGVMSATQNRAEGRPGPCFEIRTVFPAKSEALEFFLFASENYDPALRGELVQLKWQFFSSAVSSVDTPTFYPLLVQGGHLYIALSAGLQILFGGWQDQSIPQLTAANFQRMTGMTPGRSEQPDFSPTGPPMRFGFAVQHHDFAHGHTNVVRIDNLQIDGQSLPAAEFPWVEGVFAEREWITWIHPSITNATQTAKQSRRIGHPAPGLQVVTRLQTNAALAGFHLSRRAVYAPAQQGALATIDLQLEARLPREAYGQSINPSVSFVVAQAGRLFRRAAVGDAIKFTNLNDGWQSVRSVGLTETDFILTSGLLTEAAAGHPDFSARGSPLRFGFLVFHDTYYRFADRRPFDAESFYDNFRVSLHRVATNSIALP